LHEFGPALAARREGMEIERITLCLFAAIRDTLAGLRVRDLMVREPLAVRADETIGKFMDETAGSPRHSVYTVISTDRCSGC
jgi:hypothetical protein